MLYFWKLASGDLADAKQIVEKLRQKAVELRLEPTSEVIHLTDDQCLSDERLDKQFLLIGAGDNCLMPHEVVFFTANPPGEQRPFGLAAYPGHIEGDREVVSSHLPRWCWVGVIHSCDLRAARQLMQAATVLGLEVMAS